MKHVKITHETHQSVVSVQLLVLEHVAEDGRGCSGSFLTPGAKSEGQQRVREDRRKYQSSRDELHHKHVPQCEGKVITDM